jgi:hypothetical protein
MVVDPVVSSTSILVIPPRTVGFRYFRNSLKHALVASALSSRRNTLASSWLPANASAAARCCRKFEQCLFACFRMARILFCVLQSLVQNSTNVDTTGGESVQSICIVRVAILLLKLHIFLISNILIFQNATIIDAWCSLGDHAGLSLHIVMRSAWMHARSKYLSIFSHPFLFR